MKKRIYSLLLSVMLVCLLCPIKASAASNMGIKVIPEKETAQSGELITFSVYACAVEHLICGQFELSVGAGLSYQEHSAELADGIVEKLGAISVDWTEQTHMFTFYGDGDYSSTEDTMLMTFACRVEAGVGETVTATVSEPEFADTSFTEYAMVVSAAPLEIVEAAVTPTEAAQSTETPKQNIVTVITPATEAKNEQAAQSQNSQQGTVPDAANSAEIVPESAQNQTETESETESESESENEGGTSWWWLVATAGGMAGIGTFVYFKKQREQK